LQTLAGDPLVSIADVAWGLHRAPESGALAVVLRRGTKAVSANLVLAKDWRSKSDISRRVGTWQMRGMATGGLVLEDLSDEERDERKLAASAMGLRVKSVGQYGKHAAAKNAGFQKEDVIVEFDGLSDRVAEGELIGRALQARRVGDRVKVAVLRGAERVELTLPMQ
jgi:hypothetical protein